MGFTFTVLVFFLSPTIEAVLRGKFIAPGLQDALRCRFELPAVKELLAGKMMMGGVQSLDCSTLRVFASRVRAAGPSSSTTARIAGAGAQARHLALHGLLDLFVCTSALG